MSSVNDITYLLNGVISSPWAVVVLQVASYVLGTAAAGLLVWRIWAFTIMPMMRPDQPKELPYWTPWLGHAIEYVKNGQEVINNGRKYFKNTREPFAITLGGEKLYFLTSASDVSSLYRNSTSLAFDDIVVNLSMTFGISREATEKCYAKPASHEEDVVAQAVGIENPALRCFAHLNSGFWKQQLHPGELYDKLQDTFLRYLDESIRPEALKGEYVVSPSTSANPATTVALHTWAQEVLIVAALRAFFGEKLLEINPNLPKTFLAFDYDNWKLWYKWPGAKDMHAAKKEIVDTIEEYLNLPKEERPGATWLVTRIEECQSALGLTKRDTATVLTMVIFVTNTNTYKVCFWALSYLLHHPVLFERIKQETAKSVKPSMYEACDRNATPEKYSPPLDTSKLLSECPLLQALFNESLRLCSASSSIRLAKQDTVIGTKLIPKGARVVTPFRQLHYNPAVWGVDVEAFNPDRWLADKSLERGGSFRPFGGGTSYCPGRFIARQEVSVFIAIVLHRFSDVELLEGARAKRFPEIERGKPVTGLMSPNDNEDTFIRLNPVGVEKNG